MKPVLIESHKRHVCTKQYVGFGFSIIKMLGARFQLISCLCCCYCCSTHTPTCCCFFSFPAFTILDIFSTSPTSWLGFHSVVNHYNLSFCFPIASLAHCVARKWRKNFCNCSDFLQKIRVLGSNRVETCGNRFVWDQSLFSKLKNRWRRKTGREFSINSCLSDS